jgi:ferrous iron transport protein A
MDIHLSDLLPGEEATISGLDSENADHDRLLDLGLHNGTPIRIVKYAPLGDPIEIKIRGYHLSIRKSMARQIRVCRRHRGGHIAD